MSMMKYKLQKLIKFRHPTLLAVVTAGMLWLWEIKREEQAFGANSSHTNRCDFAMNYGKQGDNFERIILYRLFIILNRMSQFLVFEKADYRIAKKVGFDLLSFLLKEFAACTIQYAFFNCIFIAEKMQVLFSVLLLFLPLDYFIDSVNLSV